MYDHRNKQMISQLQHAGIQTNTVLMSGFIHLIKACLCFWAVEPLIIISSAIPAMFGMSL